MIRRKFLRQSVAASVGAGLALSGLTIPAAVASRREPVSQRFSLDLVTNKETEVLAQLAEFLSANSLAPGNVKVQLTPLAGTHVSDAVLLRDAQLVDYRVGDGKAEEFLRNLSRRFHFKRSVVEPTLIRLKGGVLNSGSWTGSANVAAGLAANQSEDNSADRAAGRAVGRAVDRGDHAVDVAADLAANLCVDIYVGDLLVSQQSFGSRPFEETIANGRNASLTIRCDAEGLRVVDSTCKHKTCVKAGLISEVGESLTCIPSRMRVVLSQRNSAGILPGRVDVVSQ